MKAVVELAEQIATRAHAGQFRRDGVTPYIAHPAAVARRLSGEPDDVIAAAWLHDVLEDTRLTATALRESGIPEQVVRAVELLTRQRGRSYGSYIEAVRGDEIARKVKIADMLHNLSDSPTERQIAKYSRGLRELLG